MTRLVLGVGGRGSLPSFIAPPNTFTFCIQDYVAGVDGAWVARSMYVVNF